MTKQMKIVEHIGDLKPDPRNARRHNPRNLGMLEDALHEVGAARSVVIDENNVILAGHGVVEAAGNAGIEKVKVVDADGETIIAVRRTGLTAIQKQRLALYDNRVAELADWDAGILAELKAEDAKLLEGLFREDELERLLGQAIEDPIQEWQGMPEFEQGEVRDALISLTIHIRNEQDLVEFARRMEQTVGIKTRYIWFPEQKDVPYGNWEQVESA